MDKDYPVTGFIGDGVYLCLDGHANEEYDEIRIETPKAICGRRLLCYSTDCKKKDCNYRFKRDSELIGSDDTARLCFVRE